MRRVLLCIDEFSELVFLDSLLKKVGFKTLGIQNSAGVGEALLSFSPEIVVAKAFGRRVDGIAVGTRAKKNLEGTKVVLLAPRNRISELVAVSNAVADTVIESPVTPRVFLETMAKLGGLDAAQLTSKFEKMDTTIEESTVVESVHVKSKEARELVELQHIKSAPRAERYKKFAEAEPLPAYEGFTRAMVESQVKEFRASEKNKDIKAIDEERLAFVKAMFGNKK